MNHKQWGPSRAGRLLTRSPDWLLTVSSSSYELEANGKNFNGPLLDLEGLNVESGLLWSKISIPTSRSEKITLSGIPNADAKELEATVTFFIRKIRVKALLANFDRDIEPVVDWVNVTKEACKTQLVRRGWLSYEFIASQISTQPKAIRELLSEPEVVEYIKNQPESLRITVSFWQRNFNDVANSINQRRIAREMKDEKVFFETVEKSPLTEEQIRAVLCFDNRVLLVASAGSGKTSTMVAKTGYALKKRYFKPNEILLLAFNKDAAVELGGRLKLQLLPLGLDAQNVSTKTFHAFSLDVIGEATGKKPAVAPWLDAGQDLRTLLELVDDLKDRDESFRTHWDLFRFVFGQDLPEFGKEEESPDSWDKDKQTEGFWTLNGEVVKSRGEQFIANWLFYNGVEYLYEADYQFDTADAQHRQYKPDFYFPLIDTYLEHWALDKNGQPPKEFGRYKEDMVWKRKLHEENQTKLLETTMAQLWSGEAFSYLKIELEKLGIALEPDPDRPSKGRKPIENPRLVRIFRSFLIHTKNNRLSMKVLNQRVESGVAGAFRYRHEMFLKLFEQVWNAWESKLKQEKCIDFEDMLLQASDLIESGAWKSPYKLIMVDEFQDASQARAMMVKGLLNAPDRYFFAVGDDWQSINRFAGSDLAVMTNFESIYGKSVRLNLETTFRCPQSLCDISSSFVQKNPNQLTKTVRSIKPNVDKPIQIISVNDENNIRAAISERIQEICSEQKSSDKPIKIYVLGRYRDDRKYLPTLSNNDMLTIDFITAHSSKGLEAEHVIIPRMTSEMLGFPSRIEDDPVMQLAMPNGDAFEYAEERRLFYVALTRAKLRVTLITVEHKESAFIAELVQTYKLVIHDFETGESGKDVCSECGKGFMATKNGRYGKFLGCSRYPKCKNTRNIH